MRKILFLTLLSILVFLLLAAPVASAVPSGGQFTSLFCPECWTYLFGHGVTDMKGNCAACGKYPLELEVRTMSWFWSPREHRWLQEPVKNSTREESLAVLARPGRGIFRAFYCPEHRTFNGVRLPLLPIVVCAVDGKPMAEVQATRRTWFWCEMEGLWTATPCPMNPVQKCCTPRTGLLLATPEPGPLAEE